MQRFCFWDLKRGLIQRTDVLNKHWHDKHLSLAHCVVYMCTGGPGRHGGRPGQGRADQTAAQRAGGRGSAQLRVHRHALLSPQTQEGQYALLTLLT